VSNSLSTPPPLLAARDIAKAFPGVQALRSVALRLMPGEVLAVVGENGAGKSTLMKILAGVLQSDAGTIELGGRPVRLASVDAAERLGIVLIHQELNLADKLDVAGNLFLGREPTWGGPLRLLSRRIYPAAEAIMRRLGLDCSPRTVVEDLAVGQQQLVEIGRALSLKSRVLIMDEPTSSLTQRETDRLFKVIRDLKSDGVSVLYISHRLQEVEIIADRVTVLRDGRNAGELEHEEIRHDAIVRLMVGRELKQFYRRTHEVAASPAPVLRAEGMRWLERSSQSSGLVVDAGEIVGLAGLMGAGRTELAEALFGVRRLLAGQLLLDERVVQIRSPTDAIAAGILLVPEDRRLQGLVLPDSVKRNISLGSLDSLEWLRLVTLRRETELAESMRQRLGIRTPSIRQAVGLLSGGNQQKVVLAKWLARAPRLLILDEPTRGVDVGAKAEIYAIMDQLAAQGVGILMISSDLEEILGMSDRVLVMHEGRLVQELTRDQLSEQAIMHYATGGKNRL
jgi:ribose transport system ATP-binding protein